MTDTPEQNESALLREELTPDQRVAPMRFGIDPGFVHFRLIENLLGPGGMKAINQQIADLATETPDWLRATRIAHIYARTLVWFCEANNVPTLGDVLAEKHWVTVLFHGAIRPISWGLREAAAR